MNSLVNQSLARSLILLIWCVSFGLTNAQVNLRPDANVPSQPVRKLDDEHGFRILVWQYKTNTLQDFELHRSVNLQGWHIDRGEGKKSLADWALKNNWPYYVDHAAGKGILHLTPRSGLDQISRDGQASARPWSFFDSRTTAELKNRLQKNIPPVAAGPVMAIALDDEVSLGTFNSPLEVDYSPAALKAFSGWIEKQYSDRSALEKAWGLSANVKPFPQTYEQIRGQILRKPPAQWRLAPWMDFRSLMDQAQANLFAEMTDHANRLAPGVPTGVVGAQQPSAYGGFDYSKLRHSIQWVEAYDIGGTNELLRSFWSQGPRRGRMQTYFLSGNFHADKWFLWYYLAHGCRSVIAWPDRNGKAWFAAGQVSPEVKRLANTFQEVQSDRMGVLAHPATTPLFSPIAILYSHPSVQVGWAIDASVHGKTWPRRSSSLDNSCLSSGKNRVAWTRLLEDIGYQARFIDTRELVDGQLEKLGTKVLILPQTFALSREECAAINKFIDRGGHVLADYGTAIVDEHGTGYSTSPLDRLFGIDRSKDRGWFDGKYRCEINGEKYNRPFLERLVVEGTLRDQNFVVAERALRTTWIGSKYKSGSAMFLNTSPTAYFDSAARGGLLGKQWRDWIKKYFAQRKVKPLLDFQQDKGNDWGVELLAYRGANDKEYWVFVSNPTRQAAVDGAGKGVRLNSDLIQLTIQRPVSVKRLVNLRTGQPIESRCSFPRDEALIIEVTR